MLSIPFVIWVEFPEVRHYFLFHNFLIYNFGLRLSFGLRFVIQSSPTNLLLKFLYVGLRTLSHQFLRTYRYWYRLVVRYIFWAEITLTGMGRQWRGIFRHHYLPPQTVHEVLSLTLSNNFLPAGFIKTVSYLFSFNSIPLKTCHFRNP